MNLSKESQEHQKGVIESFDNIIKFLDFELSLLMTLTDWHSIGKKYCTELLLINARQAKANFLQGVKGE